MNWETVIGLEVHVELSTNTKIFCGCTTQFGGEPNTHCCPVCMGMPGTLPVLNEKVLEYALKAGMALGCEINRKTQFDRKNYFYPDLPKAYQISQLYLPFAHDGNVELELRDGTKKEIGIHEIHMEEDAGKLIHSDETGETYLDFNRCGVPLIEIVTEPDFRNAQEVTAFLSKLRMTLIYLGISDCRMNEGSMRADINLSVRALGSSQLGTRTEMKNINSFREIERAIAYESDRQIKVLKEGGKVLQQTRRWDDKTNQSIAMRSKEEAHDYRYFPEPDIPPLCLSEAYLMRLSEEIPELSDARCLRFQKDYGLSEYDAAFLTNEKKLAELFEETVRLSHEPKEVCNWIMGHGMYLMKERGLYADQLNIDAKIFASFIDLLKNGKINKNVGKDVFEVLIDKDEDFDLQRYIQEKGLASLDDEDKLQEVVQSVLESYPSVVQEYIGGKEKVFGFLLGQCMKELKGRAAPEVLHRILKESLM